MEFVPRRVCPNGRTYVRFTVGGDREAGELRLWLYAVRSSWQPDFQLGLAREPQPVVVELGTQRVACTIKAHEGDGDRSYVAAGDPLDGAGWPGHREVTRLLLELRKSVGDSITCRVSFEQDGTPRDRIVREDSCVHSHGMPALGIFRPRCRIERRLPTRPLPAVAQRTLRRASVRERPRLARSPRDAATPARRDHQGTRLVAMPRDLSS